MGKYYSMTLTWQITCRFVFREWYSETMTTFVIGCVVTMLLSFFVMALPKIKKNLQKILFKKENTSSFQENFSSVESDDIKTNLLRMDTKQKIVRMYVIPSIYAAIYALLHVVIMLIMMSMNGYVIISIILGFTIGFAVFCDSPCQSKKDSACSGGCE